MRPSPVSIRFVTLGLGMLRAAACATVAAKGQYRVDLSGANEVPANTSTATGSGHVKLDSNGTTLRVQLRYSGLSSGVTGAHIHTGAAGVNGPVLVDLKPTMGGTSGTIANLVTEITADSALKLAAGELYINVHTTQYPDGEIRGQLMAHPEKSDY